MPLVDLGVKLTFFDTLLFQKIIVYLFGVLRFFLLVYSYIIKPLYHTAFVFDGTAYNARAHKGNNKYGYKDGYRLFTL